MNPLNVEELLELVLQALLSPPFLAKDIHSATLVCRRWSAILRPLVMKQIRLEYDLCRISARQSLIRDLIEYCEMDGTRLRDWMNLTKEDAGDYPLLCSLDRYLDGVANSCLLLITAANNIKNGRYRTVPWPRTLVAGSDEFNILRSAVGPPLRRSVFYSNRTYMRLSDAQFFTIDLTAARWLNDALQRVSRHIFYNSEATVQSAVNRDVLEFFAKKVELQFCAPALDFDSIYQRTIWYHSCDSSALQKTAGSIIKLYQAVIDKQQKRKSLNEALRKRGHSERRKFDAPKSKPRQSSSQQRR